MCNRGSLAAITDFQYSDHFHIVKMLQVSKIQKRKSYSVLIRKETIHDTCGTYVNIF